MTSQDLEPKSGAVGDNDLEIETVAVETIAQRVGVTVQPGLIDERMAKRALGRALGEESIRIAHHRAEE